MDCYLQFDSLSIRMWILRVESILAHGYYCAWQVTSAPAFNSLVKSSCLFSRPDSVRNRPSSDFYESSTIVFSLDLLTSYIIVAVRYFSTNGIVSMNL